jgi:tRNA dimethylallyltransferase
MGKKNKYNLISILGATASGKTSVAALLATKIDGEIISADSRQVYRGMTIGTGKDIEDYCVQGVNVPYHLVDIVDAGYQYNVFEFQRDFITIFDKIIEKNKMPILCGGSGMYLEAVLKGYKLINVPVNDQLRQQLLGKSLNELSTILKQYKVLHNKTDVDTVKRAIRAIEIEEYYATHPQIDQYFPDIQSLVFGIEFERQTRRQRISQRLKNRLDNGLVDEVRYLLDAGLTPDQLVYYGLEYKYLTQYIIGQMSYNEMFSQLETAIHQFSKRQMTWFRRMEKQGIIIHWIDGQMPDEQKVEFIQKKMQNQ